MPAEIFRGVTTQWISVAGEYRDELRGQIELTA